MVIERSMGRIEQELEERVRMRCLRPAPVFDRHHADAEDSNEGNQALEAGQA